MGVIKWLADKVQAETGEKERRENVSRIKTLVAEFKDKVSVAIDELNHAIEQFNVWIRSLNKVRNEKISENIRELNTSLSLYGNCKPVNAFVKEGEKVKCTFPEEEYRGLKDYIGEIDWTNDEVFWNTFLLTPLGMKFQTREQNILLREGANNLELLISNTLKELEGKKFSTELETAICQSYVENVTMISQIISKTVIPELKIIDAFFQAEKIKNMILCDKELTDINFEYNVMALVGTKYEKHYRFIKNAYAFYIMACKIYDTPVLTRLLQHRSTKSDKEILKMEHELLNTQHGKMNACCCFRTINGR